MSYHHHNHYVVSVCVRVCCVGRMSSFYFILAVSFCLTIQSIYALRACDPDPSPNPNPDPDSGLQKRGGTPAHTSRRASSLGLYASGGTRERAYSLQERTRGYDVCQRVTRYQSEPYRRQERQRIGECAWNRGYASSSSSSKAKPS